MVTEFTYVIMLLHFDLGMYYYPNLNIVGKVYVKIEKSKNKYTHRKPCKSASGKF